MVPRRRTAWRARIAGGQPSGLRDALRQLVGHDVPLISDVPSQIRSRALAPEALGDVLAHVPTTAEDLHGAIRHARHLNSQSPTMEHCVCCSFVEPASMFSASDTS
jgi:hypothetical protein